MGKKTSLYPCHLNNKAKIIDFAGWDMPLHYGSQVQEHHWVRQDAGVFDVSHMTILDCRGADSTAYLRRLLANNVDRLTVGKGLYSCMLNENGGVIDDLIVYKLSDESYRLVVNSATHDKDLKWLNQQTAGFKVTLIERPDLAMLALQGPNVRKKLNAIFNSETVRAMLDLKPFHMIQTDGYFIARTGYTGEDGFEIILSDHDAPDLWNKIIQANIQPCGLGARDTLRLEAGLNLYGTDMDESVTPLESNLGWTVAFEPTDRQFIGRPILEKQKKEGVNRCLVGLILETPGVLRNHQKISVNDVPVGEITSGSFSPTLNKGIALARVPVSIGKTCYVTIRGKTVLAEVVKPPFVKKPVVAIV